MEKKLEAIGRLDELDELQNLIKMTYMMSPHIYKKVNEVAIKSWQIKNDVMYFYADYDEDRNLFPVELNEAMLSSIIKKWLYTFTDEHVKYTGGDGTHAKGYRISTGSWADNYIFKVEFITLYYGK